MNIVMHCMGMPFNGTTIEHGSLGGSETAAYYVARYLASQGHRVTLFTTHPEGGEWDGVRYIHVGEVNEGNPLGRDFQFYASNTPHDVLIIQRHPQAFVAPWASKVNIWWLHDLALYRQADLVQQQLWNIDAVMVVSEYHKRQVQTVYDIKPDFIFPITNGVDPALFEFEEKHRVGKVEKPYRLVYSSRPERGLEHLVRDGGIMDQLGPDYFLNVCAYDNVTEHMRNYYEWLGKQCNKKDNISLLGSLTKRELAALMSQADCLVYPTEFEEVSCITAMEAMAAGLPMVTSKHAALPETCKGSGTYLATLKDGKADEEMIIREVRRVCGDRVVWKKRHAQQLRAAKTFYWEEAGGRVETVLQALFAGVENREHRRFTSFVHNSDIYAANKALDLAEANPLLDFQRELFAECYQFAFTHDFENHYKEYYAYEAARGVNYGPENLDGNSRFEHVSSLVADLNPGDVVLDYGCAHGHYTVNLAKRFPQVKFVGYDIEQTNIDKARDWAKSESVPNVEFFREFVDDEGFLGWHGHPPALIIAAEVVEHVADPRHLIGGLLRIANDKTLMCITTPYGPWEAQGYEEHFPWRAHLHHFERADLFDLWGKFPEFDVKALPVGPSQHNEVMGSYVTTFRCALRDHNQGLIDYDRKQQLCIGKQSLSLCMIARNAADMIGAAINSMVPVAAEVIVGIDKTTTDHTVGVLRALKAAHPLIRFEWFEIESPLETGFDQARNLTIERASGDWICWLDHDERVVNAAAIQKYLRRNQYNGFAVKQHHFAVDPAGLLKTDLPVRLFRNNRGISFYGRVHEHPEKELNKGIDSTAIVLPDVHIIHHGYDDEKTRRGRFARNYPLMQRDRKELPDRHLGMFLWIRDIAQSIHYAREAGCPVDDGVRERAREGVELWRKLLGLNVRMAKEALEYYSYLVVLLHPQGAVDYEFTLKAGPGTGQLNGGPPEEYKGTFFNKDDAKLFFNEVERLKLDHLDSPYL